MSNLLNQPPENQVVDPRTGIATQGWQPFFSKIGQIVQALTLSGTTAQRPTSFIWIGRPYFDTTLVIPIWVKAYTTGAAVWCDATGATV